MIEKRAVLCLEGVLTPDGRIIEPGVVTWDGDIAIQSDYPDHEVLGWISDIHREGNQVVGTAHLAEDWVPIGVSASLNDVEMTICHEDMSVRITKARLRAVVLIPPAQLCWPETVLS